MSFLEILLIGVALSMDAFAVCVAASMAYTNLTKWRKLSMPVAFGLFQGMMPILGFYLGSLFVTIIEKYAGIVSLVILGFIGINMIRESLSGGEEHKEKPLTIKALLAQAVATSIDAFAVGVSFAAHGTEIFTSALCFTIVTFILSLIAVFIGESAGRRLGGKAEFIGGIVLIIIGIKALF